MKQVQNQTGTLIEARRAGEWQASELCATLIDKWVAVDEPILNLNGGNYWQGQVYSSTILRRMTATTYTRTGIATRGTAVVSIPERAERLITDDEMA